MPQISVIVPVYKVEPYLHRCVDSILAQSFMDFELILVDDGSPDNCGAICDEYAVRDNRVVVIHQENGGLSAARNAGIRWAKENSESEWISLIDSDDWIHPNFLETLFIAAKKYDTVVSCCYFQMVKEGTAPEPVGDFVPHLISPAQIYCSPSKNGINAYVWRYLYQKNLFEDVEFPQGKLYEDIFTTHKLIFKTNVLAVVEQPLYYYYQRDDSIVHSKWSTKQLDRLEGYELLIRYFNNSELKSVGVCAKRGYIWAIHANYLQVLESNLGNSKKKIVAKLRRKLRVALLRYAKEVKISFKTENYLYTIAYPKLLTIYWHILGLINKLK